MRRRLKLIVTKVRRQTFAEPATSFRFFCPVCSVETEMLSGAESAALIKAEIRLLENLIADGKIHAIRTAGGNLRVCKDSLFQSCEIDLKRK